MRIVAGNHRGRKLKAVPGMNTRPTADRVKEAVFSAIGDRLYDCRFLDVFGGTGSIALEAISRGAQEAVIIEQDSIAQRVIWDNIQACREENACRLIKRDAFTALKGLGKEGKAFDLIYVDPPYQAGLYEAILQQIQDAALLARDGLIICESAKNTSITEENRIFCIYKEKTYGDTKITFLNQIKEETEEVRQ